MAIESTGAGIPNNYNKPVANTSAITPQQPSSKIANVPSEPKENTEFNNISEYKGQEIKNSKFDPDEAAKKHNINFAPKEEKEAPPKANALAYLAGALLGIIGGVPEVLEAAQKDNTPKEMGRLGTNMKMNPFGGVSEKESAEERFSKMSKQPTNTNNIPEK